MEIRLSEKIGKGYNAFWNFRGRYLLAKGSRGSKKATTAAMKIIFLMMQYVSALGYLLAYWSKDLFQGL